MNSRPVLLCALLSLELFAIPLSSAVAEDWPTFRGSERTAISSETELLQAWPEEGPPLLWTAVGAGSGYASPAVAAGRVYTLGDAPTTAEDQDEYLTCFDAGTGKQLWKTKAGPAWTSSYRGARSTPTVDGELVFVITPHGRLLCAETADGSLVWQRELKDELGGKKKDRWGYSESPLVDGERLVCTPGGERSTVVCLEMRTGETIWTCPRKGDAGAGHSSIVISEIGGRRVYVQNTGGGPMGIAADTGELMWDYDIDPPTAFIPTPIVRGDLVYSVSGYGRGGALLRQIADEGGQVSAKEVYGPRSQLGNKHGGVVLVGDNLYFGREDSSVIKCGDFMSGELLWEVRGRGQGSIAMAYADGRLYMRYANGLVELTQPSAEGEQVVGSFTTPGSGEKDKPSWAHPVISGGRLYLREDDKILCYDIAQR